MQVNAEMIGYSVAIGLGATGVMDVWGAIQSRVFGARSMSYALVGRWIGHLARGRMAHESIATAPRVEGERLMGWAAHYATGVAFAALLLLLRGTNWAEEPTLAPALLVGIGTVVFPFFVMQPALGAGIAASRTPQPNIARARSLATHAVFGLGLYLAASLIQLGRYG